VRAAGFGTFAIRVWRLGTDTSIVRFSSELCLLLGRALVGVKLVDGRFCFSVEWLESDGTTRELKLVT
jgi:hypothetical protein